jgi:hypothetical protein
MLPNVITRLAALSSINKLPSFAAAKKIQKHKNFFVSVFQSIIFPQILRLYYKAIGYENILAYFLSKFYNKLLCKNSSDTSFLVAHADKQN